MISKISTESCMTVCTWTFATRYSRVNAYYYHQFLITCELDCLYIRGFSFIQIATFLVTFISLCIVKFIRQCVRNQYIISVLGFMIFIVSMQQLLVVRLRYNIIVAYIFRSMVKNIVIWYMSPCYFVALSDTISVLSLSLCMVVFCYGSIFIIIRIMFYNELFVDTQFLLPM